MGTDIGIVDVAHASGNVDHVGVETLIPMGSGVTEELVQVG